MADAIGISLVGGTGARRTGADVTWNWTHAGAGAASGDAIQIRKGGIAYAWFYPTAGDTSGSVTQAMNWHFPGSVTAVYMASGVDQATSSAFTCVQHLTITDDGNKDTGQTSTGSWSSDNGTSGYGAGDTLHLNGNGGIIGAVGLSGSSGNSAIAIPSDVAWAGDAYWEIERADYGCVLARDSAITITYVPPINWRKWAQITGLAPGLLSASPELRYGIGVVAFDTDPT